MPTCWAVAAGETNKAVTNKAPMILTMRTTTTAVTMEKVNPMALTGMPCTRAATGSTAAARRPLYIVPNKRRATNPTVQIQSKLASSTNSTFPYRNRSTFAVMPSPHMRSATNPNASAPVIMMAMAVSPSRRPLS